MAPRYRVVADQPPTPDAKPAVPTLEDAYLALLHAGTTPAAQADDQ
jgi:hypothetical protein